MSDKEIYNPDEFVLKDIKMVHYEVMKEAFEEFRNDK